ncbi:MAG: hypothetical protein JWM11_5816 [Planctomycetaceae bacterium]|nr:hypothetical protein [Planctomycetaceae bacterium]
MSHWACWQRSRRVWKLPRPLLVSLDRFFPVRTGATRTRKPGARTPPRPTLSAIAVDSDFVQLDCGTTLRVVKGESRARRLARSSPCESSGPSAPHKLGVDAAFWYGLFQYVPFERRLAGRCATGSPDATRSVALHCKVGLCGNCSTDSLANENQIRHDFDSSLG